MLSADDFPAVLRRFRERRTPGEAGIPPASRGIRRTPGLRRDELAGRAAISEDHLKRLEQGRRRPSSGVVDALAAALGLGDADHDRLRTAAGFATAPRDAGRVPRTVTPVAARMLARLAGVPVCVTDATGTILAGNALFGRYACVSESAARRDRNMPWRAFTDPAPPALRTAEELSAVRASMVADLRTAAHRYPADPELRELITDLHRVSAEFAALWQRPADPSPGADHFRAAGRDLDRDSLSADGDLRVHVYTAPGHAGTASVTASM